MLEEDPELLQLVSEGDPNPLTELRAVLAKHIERMDRLTSDFDKLAEKTSQFTLSPLAHSSNNRLTEPQCFSYVWLSSRALSEAL